MDRSLSMLAERSREPAYSAEIRLRGRILGAHVSLLGPYYGIHRTDAPGEEDAACVEKEILASFAGYERVPRDLGRELVPDISQDGPFGCETINALLFSTGEREVPPGAGPAAGGSYTAAPICEGRPGDAGDPTAAGKR